MFQYEISQCRVCGNPVNTGLYAKSVFDWRFLAIVVNHSAARSTGALQRRGRRVASESHCG